MTTKLEKQFFETFGIEPKTGVGLVEFKQPLYPKITDHILLKLICIANSQNIGFEGDNIEDIKKDLLDNFIFFKRDVYDQIHNLFKEVE